MIRQDFSKFLALGHNFPRVKSYERDSRQEDIEGSKFSNPPRLDWAIK